MRMTARQVCRVGYGRPAIVAMLCLASTIAAANWVNINPANGEVILRVNYTGTPTVSFTVPAAQLGNGTPIQGTIGGVAYLEFEMGVDRPGGGPNLTATMTATAPATIGGTIPVSKIYWTSVAIPGDPGGTVVIASNPAGFVAGTNTIVQVTTSGTANFYAGGRLTFWYRNDDVYAAGTYGPTAINYTASRNP
jgi:hypothetical protein